MEKFKGVGAKGENVNGARAREQGPPPPNKAPPMVAASMILLGNDDHVFVFQQLRQKH